MGRYIREPRLGRLGEVVCQHRIPSFFAGTYALSWAFWIGVVAITDAESLGLVAVVPGAFGPPLAAVIITWVAGNSVWSWVRNAIRIRAPLSWYAGALLIPVAMVAVGTIGLAILGLDLLVSELPLRALAFLPTVLFMALLGGGQEELGWRGYALPRLELQQSPWMAAILLGVGWAVWHLPLFYLPGAPQFGGPFLLYAAGVIGLSVVFTWLYNRSASVAVVMVLHGSYNAALMLYPLPIAELNGGAAGSDVLAVGAITAWLAGAVLLVLTRGDLGYCHSRMETDDPRPTTK